MSTGILNGVRHTGNGLEQLKLWGRENYTNLEGYIHEQAVSDGGIVTANGSAALEFAKELLCFSKMTHLNVWKCIINLISRASANYSLDKSHISYDS